MSTGSADSTLNLTAKGERTQQRILNTALRLFEQNGYEGTTMRAIASEAEVSLGNVYRYFASKEDFVLVFYQQLCDRQNALTAEVLPQYRTFKDRLVAAIRCKLSVVEEYHAFFVEIFSVAARPDSALNPFGKPSSQVREAAVNSFADVISGAQISLTDDFRNELSWLLWLYSMGIIYFWLHDSSPTRHKTHDLIESTADVIAKLLTILALPIMAGIRSKLLDVSRTLRPSP